MALHAALMTAPAPCGAGASDRLWHGYREYESDVTVVATGSGKEWKQIEVMGGNNREEK